ncbi:MAG: hypothetical protein MZV64_71235 [Ignavibacteriales bacterium]|nr:hypothetical protein [Ignavibacteriales bacterium]
MFTLPNRPCRPRRRPPCRKAEVAPTNRGAPDIGINDAVSDTVSPESSRELRHARRRLTGLCDGRIDEKDRG